MAERDFREIEIKSILSENGTLKFDFMTSLQKIVIAKVASNLWMNKNTHQEIANLFEYNLSTEANEWQMVDFYKWQQIENIILLKIPELCLPNSITKMLKKTVHLLGNIILDWIHFFNTFILNTGQNSKHSALDLISHIAWTARGKIDFAKTAKNYLANRDNDLSNEQKYKIACTYCLEDEIVNLAPIILNQYYLDSIDIVKFPMAYFWTTYITGDDTKLYSRYNDYIERTGDNISTNEYILKLLRGYQPKNNTVPIMYMWNKLSKQEKSKNVTSLAKLDNQDLRYFLLSNVDYLQQQAIFKECSGTILVGLLNDLMWEEYFFPTALHVLEIMKPECYLVILNAISCEMCANYNRENKCVYLEHKYFFKQLWRDSSKHLKDYIFDNAIEEFLFFSLDWAWNQDFDIIDLILKDAHNAQQNKNIIFSEYGMEKCSEFIENDKWNLLESFMKYTLSSEEDINEFKERLINHSGVDIACCYLQEEAFDKIEQFITWAFKSEEETDSFRQSLACKPPFESIIRHNKVDFTKMENHFKWCTKGNLELINKLKSEILESYSGRLLIKNLIIKDQYEVLDEVLNWCYLGNQQKIAEFKCNGFKNNFSSVVDIAISLIKNDKSFKMLDKFIGWSFINELQVQEFKMAIARPQTYEYSSCVCIYLLKTCQFQLADEFLKWCGIFSEAESVLKNELMLNNNILSTIHYRGKSYLQVLIKWFKPSEDIVQKWKTISEDECRRRGISEFYLKNFLKLLDKIMENQKILMTDDRGNVSKDFQMMLDNQVYYYDDDDDDDDGMQQ